MSRWTAVVLGGGLMLILSGAAVLFGPATASGQAGASMTISPAAGNVEVGSTEDITLEIRANNVQNLGAYDFALKFDPAVLEFVGASDYGMLATTGRTQSCFSFDRPASTFNDRGVVHAGCGTNGLIDGGQGNAGPSGSGILAIVVFRPRAVGLSNLVFVGLDAPYPLGTNPPESAQTSLSFVETCDGLGHCDPQFIDFAPETGAIRVFGPDVPTPVALPNTPTPEPRDDTDNSDFRATVAAAVGTPRVLATPVPGASTTGENPTGTTSGQQGETASGGVGGSTSGGGTLSASGNGELPEGVTIGPDGIPRGPDGVPIAGYGPQEQEQDQRWIWGGIGLLLAGFVVTVGGVRLRPASARET